MAFFNVIKRSLSTSSVCNGKKNFRKFLLYNKAGTKAYKEERRKSANPEIPIYKRGIRDTGIMVNGRFTVIPEKIPELIVPDLTDFPLKAYVSYRTVNVTQSEFTAKNLFDAVYAKKIEEDFKAGKLDADGNPLEPSEHELLTAEEAKNRALKTGCDLYEYRIPKYVPKDSETQ